MTTIRQFTKEDLECILPNPLTYRPERGGEEAYRTWFGNSKDKDHISINIPRQI